MTTPLDPMRRLPAVTDASPRAPDPATRASEAPRTAEGQTFQDVLTGFIREVDQSQQRYDQAITAVVSGDTDNLHRVMLAQSDAQMSLMLAVQVRNKVVDAYKEAMRMQL